MYYSCTNVVQCIITGNITGNADFLYDEEITQIIIFSLGNIINSSSKCPAEKNLSQPHEPQPSHSLAIFKHWPFYNGVRNIPDSSEAIYKTHQCNIPDSLKAIYKTHHLIMEFAIMVIYSSIRVHA